MLLGSFGITFQRAPGSRYTVFIARNAFVRLEAAGSMVCKAREGRDAAQTIVFVQRNEVTWLRGHQFACMYTGGTCVGVRASQKRPKTVWGYPPINNSGLDGESLWLKLL